jgi:NAD(P)-dependent dehydrogenase (short-subunit alcohol dehydrogenase family)
VPPASASRSVVVTGGGRGVGRAVVERLLRDGAHVVAIELDAGALDWLAAHPRAIGVAGSAADEAVTEEAADRAEQAAPLTGWVNNAAVFRDASVHTAPAREVLDLVHTNLAPAVVGATTAVRRFLAAGTGGAIVNVSSHQAQRAVPGCTPYVTAKAAIEGLTRALAVEYGPRGVRVNAVALGSIATERYAAYLDGLGPSRAAHVEEEMRRIHPLGRVGAAAEVAAVIAHLLSDDAAYVTGATVPVDGGRSVLARDPEAHDA